MAKDKSCLDCFFCAKGLVEVTPLTDKQREGLRRGDFRELKLEEPCGYRRE